MRSTTRGGRSGAGPGSRAGGCGRGADVRGCGGPHAATGARTATCAGPVRPHPGRCRNRGADGSGRRLHATARRRILGLRCPARPLRRALAGRGSTAALRRRVVPPPARTERVCPRRSCTAPGGVGVAGRPARRAAPPDTPQPRPTAYLCVGGRTPSHLAHGPRPYRRDAHLPRPGGPPRTGPATSRVTAVRGPRERFHMWLSPGARTPMDFTRPTSPPVSWQRTEPNPSDRLPCQLRQFGLITTRAGGGRERHRRA